MSRDHARETVSELSGTVMGIGMLAASNPGGALVLACLVTVVSAVVVVSIDVWNAREAWAAYAIVLGLVGMVLLGHRFLWGLVLNRRAARVVTALVLLSGFSWAEYEGGPIGRLVGGVTGFNPEVFLSERLGVPMSDGLRYSNLTQKATWARQEACKEAKATGAIFAATSAAVQQAKACANLFTVAEQRRACFRLDERKDRMIDYLDENYCRGIGAYVTARVGAMQ